MDEAHQEFFEDLARHLNYWVQYMHGAATEPSFSLIALTEYEDSLRVLQKSLTTPEEKAAFRAALFAGMCGLLHSVLVMLDGGTQLADKFMVTLRTEEDEILGPNRDLHDGFYEHLYNTGRLPYKQTGDTLGRLA